MFGCSRLLGQTASVRNCALLCLRRVQKLDLDPPLETRLPRFVDGSHHPGESAIPAPQARSGQSGVKATLDGLANHLP